MRCTRSAMFVCLLSAWAVAACGDEVFIESRGGDAGDASADAATDSRAEAGGGGLRCGDARCRVPEETCCLNPTNGSVLSALFTSTEGKCVPYESCLPPSISIRCNTPNSCREAKPGSDEVCCISHANDRFTTFDCMPRESCQTSGPHDILCDPSKADAYCTPSHPRCAQSTSFPTKFDVFGICTFPL